MKIVFYNETLLSGGIETSMQALIDYLCNYHEIEVVYIDETKLNPEIVNGLKEKAYVHKINPDEIIEADVCIWCRLYMNYHYLKQFINAKRNYLWVHSLPYEDSNCILEDKDVLKDIDKIICVSKTVQNLLNVENDSLVIHNFLPPNIKELANIPVKENIFSDDSKLKLVTVSRLSRGKGFDRVLKLVNTLKNNNINFEYIVLGNGRSTEQAIKDSFKDIPEVTFLGYKKNPYPYIKKADYLVQLSDSETWGNVITESKLVGTPVIITNFDSAYEQIEDDYNGILIDLKTDDYAQYIPRIINNKNEYRNNLKDFKFDNETQKWDELF